MAMADNIRILSIANCGILISTEHVGILVDGICEETEYFDGLDTQLYQKMMAKENPFERIDYILYTHNHSDHLDFERLAEYLAQHSVSGLLLPQTFNQESVKLKSISEKKRIQLQAPEFGAREMKKWEMGDAILTYFFVAHSGKEYAEVNHYALLIEVAGKKIYFSGDSDFTEDSQIRYLIDMDVDIAFYNPYHLNSPSGRKIIKAIGAKNNFIYHIPPEEKDEFYIRKRAIRNQAKYQNVLSPTTLILARNMDICKGLL